MVSFCWVRLFLPSFEGIGCRFWGLPVVRLVWLLCTYTEVLFYIKIVTIYLKQEKFSQKNEKKGLLTNIVS